MEVHAPWEEKSQYFSVDGFPWYSKAVYRNAILGADALVVVSTAMKKYLTQWGADDKKIHVIPNAVDSDIFSRSNEERVTQIKVLYGLHGKKVIGFIGSMAPYHGVGFMIEAASHIISEFNDVVFVLIGPFEKDETRNTVLARIDHYHLKDYFILTGGVNFSLVPVWIDCMDIGVMPDSNWYGSPIKLFEYGAKGIVVVMPRLSPIEDIIVDGHNGILFEPKNSADLAKKIIFALKEQDRTMKMGSELKNKVFAEHTWLNNAKRIESIASNLMKQKT
jgi:glycosyltransferase involved in cell wall biosynthesis